MSRPSQTQMEKLVQFLEENPGIAKGHLRTAQARHHTKIKWEEIAIPLNSLGGTTKDAKSWAKNYKLDFVQYNSLWGGAVATIVRSEEEHVWGAVWKMKNGSLISLDRQEGVDEKHYFPKEVDISGVNGKKTKCRTYQHCFVPPFLKSLSSLPEDRRPSITYKQCIVSGAVECHMPEYYVSMLKTIPNNGRHGTDELRRRLKL